MFEEIISLNPTLRISKDSSDLFDGFYVTLGLCHFPLRSASEKDLKFADLGQESIECVTSRHLAENMKRSYKSKCYVLGL